LTAAGVIIARARMLGVKLRPEGEMLRYRGQRCAVAEILQDLAAHKPELIALLREGDPLVGTAFTIHGYLCRRCKRLGRVAVIGGEIACTFCVVAEAERVAPNSDDH
jgi:hypothetical protein